MGILNRLTIKNLKLNKKRTIVTIIAIILSTSLITSVTTLASSIYKSNIEHCKSTYGDYHYVFHNVQAKDIGEIKNNKNIENLFITKEMGYSNLLGKFNIQILGFYGNALEQLGVKIVEGKMPQKENEILISDNIYQDEQNGLKIGDEISLLISNSESATKTYKIVGRINGITEAKFSSSTSYLQYGLAITYINNFTNEENLDVYIRFKSLTDRNETVAQILNMDELTFNKLESNSTNRKELENNIYRNNTNKYKYSINERLITLEIGDFADATSIMLYSVTLVVSGIIIITSVYCIKNSFNISITEKVKLYGMLSSIGATSKQIKRNVLYEAFILGVIAIPIGIVLGITSIYVLLKIAQQILAKELSGMNFIFSVNLLAINIAILLSILTIYLSARKAAKKASKISPIEAIKSNQDIKIKSKKIKSPKFIKTVFGIGGEIAYKNLKRSKNKYRTTVISIIVSVATFIAISSFISNAFKVTKTYFGDYNYDIYAYGRNYEKMKEITEDAKIKEYSLLRTDYAYLDISNDLNDSNADYYYTFNKNSKFFKINSSKIDIVAVGKNEYNRYINKLGLKYDDVKEKAILLDYKNKLVNDNGNKVHKKFRIYSYKKGDIIELDFNEQTLDIEIAAITDVKPMELVESSSAYLIVSDEFMDKYSANDDGHYGLYIKTQNDVELEEYIKEKYSDSCFYIGNINEEEREQKTNLLVASIFLYTFIIIVSLIGITNIFNTITTNMEIRQQEFANLKSIGMTKKEFNKMIRLESLFYGFKSLIIGIPLGIVLSYLIYKAFTTNMDMSYIFPIKGIIISILTVAILIGSIMRYSLDKINKQNIIETIRKENI